MAIFGKVATHDIVIADLDEFILVQVDLEIFSQALMFLFFEVNVCNLFFLLEQHCFLCLNNRFWGGAPKKLFFGILKYLQEYKNIETT